MPRIGMLISNTYKEVIMAKRATKKAAPKKSAAKRELIAPRGAKRYIRRAAAGRIKESDDVGRSLAAGRQRRRQSPDRVIAATEKALRREPRGKNRVPGDRRTLDLFGDSALPEGFRYQPEFLSRGEERSLLQYIEKLPFREFEFHGFTGKRRIVSFGWRYDFNGGGLTRTEDMPHFLSGVRARAEAFAGTAPGGLQQVLI